MEHQFPRKRYWFYAKSHGYGWGLPATWEGWGVYVGFLAAAFGGVAVFPPDPSPLPYVAYLTVISLLLLLACYAKGEPARWRWGDTSDLDRPARPASGGGSGASGQLLMHLFLGPVILGVAIFFRVYPPEKINHTYGYRTAAAMCSQEAWDDAQEYSAKAMSVAGAVVVLYQILSLFIMRPGLSLVTSTIVLMLAIFAVLPITEAHLKKTFDARGQRIELRVP